MNFLKFNIDNGDVYFQSRLMNSKYYNQSKYEMPLYRTLGGLSPNMTHKQEIETKLHFMHDNLNANIVLIGDNLVAVSDLAGDIIIDMDTLDVTGDYNFINQEKLNIITSAHPQEWSVNKNIIFNYESDIMEMKYKFYFINTSEPLKEGQKYSKKYFYEFKTDKSSSFSRLQAVLENYKVEDYRKNIYPFNSSEYLSYINKTSFEDSLKFTNLFQIDTKLGFIRTPIEPKSWVKSEYITNLFNQKLTVGNSDVNILNTPYFHEQLFNDYFTKSAGKYVGSAYLLLNSLPFKDLEDTLTFSTPSSPVNMASMFKEVGSTHYVPYHLMLKWGSIYHRYKKYIIDGIDILTGFTTSNVSTTTTSINGSLFFSGATYTGTTHNTFTISGTNINYSTEIGIHPYYENIFHEVINDYPFYDYTLGNTSFSAITADGTYVSRNRNEKEIIKLYFGED